jgi:hypothetical protein
LLAAGAIREVIDGDAFADARLATCRLVRITLIARLEGADTLRGRSIEADLSWLTTELAAADAA